MTRWDWETYRRIESQVSNAVDDVFRASGYKPTLIWSVVKIWSKNSMWFPVQVGFRSKEYVKFKVCTVKDLVKLGNLLTESVQGVVPAEFGSILFEWSWRADGAGPPRSDQLKAKARVLKPRETLMVIDVGNMDTYRNGRDFIN